jgi:hypothetical protein
MVRRLPSGPMEGRSHQLAGLVLSPSRRLRPGSASWSALLRLAFVRSDEAGRGVNLHGASRRARQLLGPFVPHKGCSLRDAPRDSGTFQDAICRSSPAGATPGHTTNGLYAHSRGLVERAISKSDPAIWHDPRKTRMRPKLFPFTFRF